MNPYQATAAQFIDRTLDMISTRADGVDVLVGLMTAALGFERIMKGVLWDVNPTYTLIDTSFKNSAPVLYAERIKLVGSQSQDEIAARPNGDVISFRSAVLRSGLFSKIIDNNRAFLLKLNSYRDIIAHCDLGLLDEDDARAFLLGSVYPLVSIFAKERLIVLRKRMADEELLLNQVSIDFTIDVPARLKKRIELHRTLISRKSGVEIQRIENLPHPKTRNDQWDELMDCPACGYKAHVRFEVDFDVEGGQAYPNGVFADYLSCPYCGLRVDDYQELEALGISVDKFYEDEGGFGGRS